MPDPDSIIVPVRNTLRWLVAATVVLYVALAGLGLWVYSEADSNGDALCALRADLEKRVESSQQFLIDHPDGIAGIPARTIREGIENQRRTIDALGDLSC